jgi:hypothetical protein
MVKHGIVTVTTSAQSLSSGLGASVDTLPRVGFLSLQPGAANSGVVYVGGPGVSTTVYGFRLEIPVSSIPCAPWFREAIGGAFMSLSDVYVVGTASDKVSVMWIPYE